MSADLDKTLGELGSEYAGVVERLKSSCEIEPRSRNFAKPGRKLFWRYAVASAAAVVVAVMFFGFGGDGADPEGVELSTEPSARTASLSDVKIHSDYSLAFNVNDKDVLNQLVSTQLPDGSWGNDFLTRQNAAALKKINQTSVSFRKALRYLRSKGLRPLDDQEFIKRRQEYCERCLTCRF